MPALTADVEAATRPYQVETWSNSTIHTRYPSAKDGGDSPAEGYFDSTADAQTIVTARGALFGVESRRFTVVAQDLLWPNDPPFVERIELTDPDQGLSATDTLLARIEVDLNGETTSFEVFG